MDSSRGSSPSDDRVTVAGIAADNDGSTGGNVGETVGRGNNIRQASEQSIHNEESQQPEEETNAEGSVALDSQNANTNRLMDIMDYTLFDHGERIGLEYYDNENTIKKGLHSCFFRDYLSCFPVEFVSLCLKVLTCFFYVIRIMMDPNATCFECPTFEKPVIRPAANSSQEHNPHINAINWDRILWVNRPYELWLIQVIIAYIGLARALFMLYSGHRGSIRRQVFSFTFVLEMITTIPFTITVFHPKLRNIFIPVFLNCWLAKTAMQNMFSDLRRAMLRTRSVFSQHLILFLATVLCFVFTIICGIEHLQRASPQHLNIFQALYYVVATFLTVGYNNHVYTIWPCQLFTFVMICIAFVVLPPQFKKLTSIWMERRRLGRSGHRDQAEKHVVVCCAHVQSETIMDFLNEFYADPLQHDYRVVLLSPMELDSTMKMILRIPCWSKRVIFIRGTCLNDGDLKRAGVDSAEACFILTDRNEKDKSEADDDTILRSWAVKHYAPEVPQYVHIIRTEDKRQVTIAEQAVCQDELKFTLLAYNCIVPGLSTLVTLLLHTSAGKGQLSAKKWPDLYGRGSGNGVHHIRLANSKFFAEYEGKSFTYASFHCHRKFGVALIGVIPASTVNGVGESLVLNPGSRYVMNRMDTCIYMSITKEEHTSFAANTSNSPSFFSRLCCRSRTPGVAGRNEESVLSEATITVYEPESDSDPDPDPLVESIPLRVIRSEDHPNPPQSGDVSPSSRRPSISSVPDNITSMRSASDGEDNSEHNLLIAPWTTPGENIWIRIGLPPFPSYIGVNPSLCYLLYEKIPVCCLQLAQECEHYTYRTAYEHNWFNKPIIIIADVALNGIFNFIISLRAHNLPLNSLHPIVLMFEFIPDAFPLDAISNFPLVYWMLGSIDSVDDLLRAGIVFSQRVVVVNKELSKSSERDTSPDWKTILSVQNMMKYFPNVTNITELSQSSNMRFVHFAPFDKYALHLSEVEKAEKKSGSPIPYMFRPPFASGKVFSASMLDTLLYQSFVKDYIINFVRSLLGLDQTPGSGFLKTMTITNDDMWIRTYGRLYQKLCSTTCEIPIAIYRTEDPPEESWKGIRMEYTRAERVERAKMAGFVKARMNAMNLPSFGYDAEEKPGKISYVIINPDSDLSLQEGDIIYLITPSSISARRTLEREGDEEQITESTWSLPQSEQQTSDQNVGSASTDTFASITPINLAQSEFFQQDYLQDINSSLGVSQGWTSDPEDVGLLQPLRTIVELQAPPPEVRERPSSI